MTHDPLRSALEELVRELKPHGIRLIVGGGFGLVLRAEHIRSSGKRTMRPAVFRVRSTDDIDCFLQAEIITDDSRSKTIRDALDRLGYKPVMEHLQFAREVEIGGQIRSLKIDFLAAPVVNGELGKVKVDDVRIRPKGYKKLHARLTPEAFALGERLLPIDVSQDGSALYVLLPHPFSFLILKLFALRDRLQSQEGMGKYHALDMFTIWSLMTEPEWNEAQELRSRFSSHSSWTDVVALTEELFGKPNGLGATALRDQALSQGSKIRPEDIESFRNDVCLLLGTRG